MASITDTIESFIKELMKEGDTVQIQRNELANLFSCAPSQINYVLTTRFTLDRGYRIESKKGGGGYVQILRVHTSKLDYTVKTINNNIGNQITFRDAKIIVNRLREKEFINKREERIILCSIDDKTLNIPVVDIKDKVRANILKNILIGAFSIEG